MAVTKSSAPSRDWTPRRRGPIYCSPVCGSDCTWAAYQSALKLSAALAKRLGKGWDAHVWENCGWHYVLYKGPLSVHVSVQAGRRRYWAQLTDDPTRQGYGSMLWSNQPHCVTPEAAIRGQLQEAQAVIARLQATVRAAGGTVPE